MSFEVEYIRSDGKIEPVEHGHEDAFLFLPGGVLGIWQQKPSQATYHPPGTWRTVKSLLHRPGEYQRAGGEFVPAIYLFPLPPPPSPPADQES